MEKMRLFTAIRLPERLLEPLGAVCRFGPARSLFASWPYPEDYHITLQFLGDTETAAVPGLTRALERAALQSAPFRLRLAGTGSFGRPEAPRVLWAGVEGERDRLAGLQRAVTAATGPLGFRAEERAYSPHVTLARKFRGGPEDRQALEQLRTAVERVLDEEGGLWEADRMVLLATRMGAVPMYETIAEFSLNTSK
ncbi:RNA 2',3'-cyclic phosphodiesterase [Paenibacillus glufosinatiresistens]|uniref:RNA 2',3'-cyclic phosphodiesterase n=1 Tax=Paenibacillus glufosinatiresistens TaxID=3070657 RepID=UPI00286E12EE|nr:RNA 2',3'-cyclic phosphodiesterase [Paenibacillus sp. YX.27]